MAAKLGARQEFTEDSENASLGSKDSDNIEDHESRSEDSDNFDDHESESSANEFDLSDNDDEAADNDSKAKPQGLANVMTKILNKAVGKPNVILAKAKTDKELLERRRKKAKSTPGQDIEVVGKEDLSESEESSDEDQNTVSFREQHSKKRSWEEMCRVKPDVLEKERERALQSIATRGVVQLFNAVKSQQKHIEEKLTEAKSVRRKENVLSTISKGQFIDVLKGTAVTNSTKYNMKAATKNEKETKPKASKETPAWSILRDDFMTSASIKDWDKESDDSDSDDEGVEQEERSSSEGEQDMDDMT